jgi:hypothetical protein
MMYVAVIEDDFDRDVRVFPRKAMALQWLAREAEAIWLDSRTDDPPADPEDLIDLLGDLSRTKMWIATVATPSTLAWRAAANDL